MNASQTTVVREAWARGQQLAVHGWVYDVGDGLLRDLGICVAGEAIVSTPVSSPPDSERRTR